jgi:hypothetical protein
VNLGVEQLTKKEVPLKTMQQNGQVGTQRKNKHIQHMQLPYVN